MSRQTTRAACAVIAALAITLGSTTAAALTPATTAKQAFDAVRRLDGAMPTSMDIYPSDPCAGIWHLTLPSDEEVMTLIVFRYAGRPLVHMEGPNIEETNLIPVRTSPNSIRLGDENNSITLRCVGARGVGEFRTERDTKPVIVTARQGSSASTPPRAATSPQRTPQAASPLPAPGPTFTLDGGIMYKPPGGVRRRLTDDATDSLPVLSPDRKLVAFTRVEPRSAISTSGEVDEAWTALWIIDVETGSARKLVKPRIVELPERNLTLFQNLMFSLDGSYVYFEADAWATSAAIHRVDVATGHQGFFKAGGLIGIIRTGPYRGYLLVQQHLYRQAPAVGSYDAVNVIRPDGHVELMVPGSDEDAGERSVAAWLRQNGWQSW